MDILEFHRRTNHIYASVRRPSRGLDWPNKPDPFKEYPDLPLVDLPAPRQARPPLEPGRLTRESLAHILYYSAGITRIRSRSFSRPTPVGRVRCSPLASEKMPGASARLRPAGPARPSGRGTPGRRCALCR